MPGSTDLIGSISLFAKEAIPKGWLRCNGSTYKMAEYQALYGVIGTTFGGREFVEFAVPNLEGRTVVGSDTGFYHLGRLGGAETVKLNKNEIGHSHTANCFPDPGDDQYEFGPADSYFSKDSFVKEGVQRENYSSNSESEEIMSEKMILTAGTKDVEGHDNMQPYLPLVFCICAVGVYPTGDSEKEGGK